MKNIKCFLLCFMAVFLIGNTELHAQVSYWNGSDTTVWTQGAGTMANPYLIESAANLACLAARVNAGTTYSGVYFKLMTNVNLGAGNWTPIGISTTKYFSGFFDGNNLNVDSLTINYNASATSFMGLFGITQNSTIKNLTLSNINVSQTSASASIFTGGLLGATMGGDYISNCKALSGEIYSVSSTAGRGYAGGIVGCIQFGANNLRIENCINYATIKANYSPGGIVGMINVTSTVSDTLWFISCSNNGCILGLPSTGNLYGGGVIGWLNIARNNTEIYIDNCYNTGYVKDSTNEGTSVYTGGLIGYLQGAAATVSGANARITNCWNSGKIENISTSIDITTNKWFYAGGITGNMTIFGIANILYQNVHNTGEIYYIRRSPKKTVALAGIVGIMNLQLSGSVFTLSKAYNTGNVTLLSPDTANNLTFAGGLIGWIYNLAGTYNINQCFNAGNIFNQSIYAGGIAGYVDGFSTSNNVIQHCFNSGNISSFNTAGGITACYSHKGSNNTISNCISVGIINTPLGGSGIAGTIWDSTALNLATCYYDRQITGRTRGGNPIGTAASKTNDTIRYARQLVALQLDPNYWYMEADMYPRLLCFQNLDAMILGAAPYYFYAEPLANSFNTYSKINKNFSMGGKMGTFYNSSNTGVISIINNDSALITPIGIDTITITSMYGYASRSIQVIVMKETIIETEVCQGEVYQILGRTINTDSAGLFTYYGVDSIIYVTVHPTYLIQENYTICSNDNYVWHGQIVNQAGDYYDTLASVNGCDSIYKLSLTVNPIANEVDSVIFCSNDLPLLYQGVFINHGGDYTTTYVAANGCDSIIGIHVTVNQAYDTIIVAVVAEAELPYTFGSQTLTEAGTYSELFTSLANCDSLVHLVLVVGNLSGDTLYSNDSKKICKSDLPYQYGTSVFPIGTESGVYEVGFMSTTGKDSIVFLYLTINDIPAIPDSILGPQTINALGKYTYSVNPVESATEYRWGVSNSMFVFEDETNISNNAVLYIAVAGNAILTVAAGNQCGFSADQSLQLLSDVSVREADSKLFSAQLFPNPAQDYVDMKLNGSEATTICIVDVYGKLIKIQTLTDSNTRINLSDVSNGIYFIQIKNDNQLLGTYKVVRNK